MNASAPSQVPVTLHHAAVYGSDDEFLAVTVPFARDGIAAGDPVFAVADPANLEMLPRALGGDAARVDWEESASFYGRRRPQRVAALEKYARQRRNGGRVRVLAEPPWVGWTDAEVRDWQQMEAGLNLVMDGTGLWMTCPYDTRQLPEPVIDSARRTHPTLVEGTATRPSPGYADPAGYAASHDDPLPPPPGGAALLAATASLRDIRRFAAAQAAAAGSSAAGLMSLAVHETAAYLKNATGSPVTTLIWQRSTAVGCDLHADGPAAPGTLPPAFDGYRMPQLTQPRRDDCLWYARQLTTRLDLRATTRGIQARLQLPGARHINGA